MERVDVVDVLGAPASRSALSGFVIQMSAQTTLQKIKKKRLS
jgi:hypothetical protein